VSKKKKAEKQAKPANPAKIAAKLIEVGEVRKSEVSPALREKADKASHALQHEVQMANSPGYVREMERREAEAARAA